MRVFKRLIVGASVALFGLATAFAQGTQIDSAVLQKASAGDPAAQVQAGELYAKAAATEQDRDLVPEDWKQVEAWYRKAAEQGDTGAQGTVGMLYLLGQGVAHSDADAYFWLDIAANTPGPSQGQYIANRQNVGQRLTTTEVDDIHYRAMKWKAAHAPKPPAN